MLTSTAKTLNADEGTKTKCRKALLNVLTNGQGSDFQFLNEENYKKAIADCNEIDNDVMKYFMDEDDIPPEYKFYVDGDEEHNEKVDEYVQPTIQKYKNFKNKYVKQNNFLCLDANIMFLYLVRRLAREHKRSKKKN